MPTCTILYKLPIVLTFVRYASSKFLALDVSETYSCEPGLLLLDVMISFLYCLEMQACKPLCAGRHSFASTSSSSTTEHGDVLLRVMFEYDSYVFEHVAAFRGGLVNLDSIPTWKLKLTSGAGNLLRLVNLERGTNW